MSAASRIFIAIPICPETAAEAYDFLVTRREQLMSGSWAKRVRWVAPEQFHMTLRFLGPVAESDIAELAVKVETSVADVDSFTLKINKPSLFPRASRAKVIACPVEHKSELKQLMRRVNAACATLPEQEEGKAADDRFRAHITLGRIRRTDSGSKAPNLPSFPGEASLAVGQVDIVASLPFKEGVQHKVLHRVPL